MTKTTKIISWIIAVLVGLNFIIFGGLKFLPAFQEGFDTFNLPNWLRIAIGTVEVLFGILLFIPSTARIAGIVLSFICVGAMFTHFLYGQYLSILMPLAILVLLILFVRWRSLPNMSNANLGSA